MNYSVDWLIENEIIFVQYSGPMNAVNLRISLQQVRELIEKSPRQRIHVITDVGDISRALPMSDAAKIVREFAVHPRVGWRIILRERSIFVKVGILLATAVFETQTKMFATLEEAQEFLTEQDPNISWHLMKKNLSADIQ
jgi:hypothetical protein